MPIKKTRFDQIWVPILLIAYNFIANLANDIYLPSMPAIAKFFDVPPNIVQITAMAWFLGIALPQLFLGPLSDRIGRRPVLFSGGICFSAGTLICMIVPNIECLIVARFIQGVGVSTINIVCFSIITDLYTPKKRLKTLTYLTMCSSLSPIIGPLLSGHVLAWLSWRFNFLIIFIFLLSNLIGLSYKLPESNLHKNPDALNLKYVFSSYLSLVKNKSFIGYLMAYCFILAGLVAYLTGAPFVLIRQLNMSPGDFGYIQLFVFSMFIVGSLYLVTYGLKHHKAKHLLASGLTLVCLSVISMLLASMLWKHSVIAFILPMFFYNFGFSLCASPLINGVMSIASDMKGFSSALLGFAMALCGVLASSLTVLFYNGTLFSVAIIIFVMGSLAVLFFSIAKFK